MNKPLQVIKDDITHISRQLIIVADIIINEDKDLESDLIRECCLMEGMFWKLKYDLIGDVLNDDREIDKTTV